MEPGIFQVLTAPLFQAEIGLEISARVVRFVSDRPLVCGVRGSNKSLKQQGRLIRAYLKMVGIVPK
jgi:hypothetical protein